MGYLKDGVFLLVSLIGGLLGVVVSSYIYVFVMNIHILPFQVPTVDGNPHCDPLGHILSFPLWNNLLLLSLFTFQHSFMIRGPVRKVLDMFLDEEQVRVVFVLGACATLGSAFVFWMPMPYKLWDIQLQQLRLLIYGLSLASIIGVVYSLLVLDPFSLLGVKPLVEKVLKWKKELHFVVTGPYGLVRHPSYAFLFLSIWITPSMSVGHALFSSIITVYTMLAVAYLEEPDLVRNVGPQYVEYMKTTPRYIPRLLCPVKRKKET